MNADEFAAIFDTEVRHPLATAGFRSSGKSLFHTDGFGCLSLIRLGGRLAAPGGISHVLCFRHTFLRTLDETTPRGFVSEVFAYPYKFLLADFSATKPPPYRPRNLNYDYDRFEFDGISAAMLRDRLRHLRSTLIERAVPWVRRVSPRLAADEIRRHGEDAWIERIWLLDYSAHLSNATGNA
ncbi:MAG: hypothetical protein J0M24_05010 [Verrucomicrobia bacterium]|nr:hypothetical protein [Verrucomicrobiota bacterium]